LASEFGAGSWERALDVVIVSYRCEALLRGCLESLRWHPAGVSTRVHVIDNASQDGTSEMVAREFPLVELTVNQRNAGFAAAANLGIAAGSAPRVLVLNPDCEIRQGTLDRLLDLLEARPEVGICGPALVRPGGEPDHAAKRGFPTPLSSLGHFAGLGRRPRAPAALRGYAPDPSRGGPVDAVNGAFMLIRRSALDEVGLFDEGYWMYMEDLDLSYRFAQAGWTTRYEPSATVVHVKAGTSGPIRSARLNRAFHYGMYRFYRRHYARSRSPLVNIAVYAGIGAKLAVSVSRAWVARLRSSAR
jgi:N-acetylglucosaminyl-diphospho-decaprenol L-rhamnosyltransferase